MVKGRIGELPLTGKRALSILRHGRLDNLCGTVGQRKGNASPTRFGDGRWARLCAIATEQAFIVPLDGPCHSSYGS